MLLGGQSPEADHKWRGLNPHRVSLHLPAPLPQASFPTVQVGGVGFGTQYSLGVCQVRRAGQRGETRQAAVPALMGSQEVRGATQGCRGHLVQRRD